MLDTPKSGDLVQLNSGGPIMTVAEVESGDKGVILAVCGWFNGKKQETRTFPIAMLKRAGI